MKQVVCEHCQSTHPMNEMFGVFGRSLCEACAQNELANYQQGPVPEGAIVRQVDPTLCKSCQADNGAEPWRVSWGLPLCDACERSYRHRPFPGWIKLASLVLVALVIISFVHNKRFIQGYIEFLQVKRALAAGNMPEASRLLNSAHRHVPESDEIAEVERRVASVIGLERGVRLLKEDKPAEALPILKAYRENSPAEGREDVDRLILFAEMGVAFDVKNYELLLDTSKRLRELEPERAETLASVAGAYACQYAATGQDDFKKESLQYLEQAKQKAGPGDHDFEVYENRIQHRLATREVISRKQFEQRYPHGWKPEAQP